MKKIPVILDTDIGSDIDDTWALGLLLACPELDLKLVVVNTDDTIYKAKIVAKFLEVTGNAHIPVSIGPKTLDNFYPQKAWVEGYELDSYPGGVISTEDMPRAVSDVIHGEAEEVTVIAIGPATSVAAALDFDPTIAEHSRLIGLFGSIYRGHGDSVTPCSEYNLRVDIPGGRKVFAAPWNVLLIPLDTSANLVIDGERYQKFLNNQDKPIPRAILENFNAWMIYNNCTYYKTQSTILFDTAAIYAAISTDILKIEHLNITVRDDGFTVIDDKNGVPMDVATEWKDVSAFYDFVIDRICE